MIQKRYQATDRLSAFQPLQEYIPHCSGSQCTTESGSACSKVVEGDRGCDQGPPANWKGKNFVRRTYLSKFCLISFRSSTDDEEQYVLATLERTPDMYLDELVDELATHFDIPVSISTLSHTLKRLGMSNKKLSKVASEWCEVSRLEFQFSLSGEPAERLVFADESLVNVLTTYQMNGWSMKGTRAQKSTKFVRGKR